MRKVTSILLILLFTANICGASISYHFCGKLLQYYAFNGSKKKSKCCRKGTQKKKGCCKTEHHKVTVDESKSFTKQLVLQKQPILKAIIPQPFYSIEQGVKLTDFPCTAPLGHTPPVIRTVPIHILQQQFLI